MVYLILAVKGPIASTVDFVKTLFVQEPRRKGLNVNQWIDGYNHLQRPEDASGRNQHYDKMVDYFYELVTPFYEWGWGSSFHFAYRLKGESFAESMRRHEYYLSSWLGLPPRSRVLDLGCGIGGPTRNIGRFTGEAIVDLWLLCGGLWGYNSSTDHFDSQAGTWLVLLSTNIKWTGLARDHFFSANLIWLFRKCRGTELSRQQNLSHAIEFRQADFMKPLDFFPEWVVF